jgi:hypothetical protein
LASKISGNCPRIERASGCERRDFACNGVSRKDEDFDGKEDFDRLDIEAAGI